MNISSFRIWLGCLLLLPLAVWAKQYSAESIEAWVVDDETGKPLKGVIVTANWQVLEGTLAGTNTGGQLQILETVTDANGRFYFPAWGPKPLPPKKTGWMVDRYIGNEDPQLLLFKSGYEFLPLANPLIVNQRNTALVRKSQWNGKTIRLKRFSGTPEQYADHLRRSQGLLGFAYSGEDCYWTRVPRMLATLENESQRLNPEPPASIGPFDTLDRIGRIPQYSGCPAPKDFFKEYLR